MNEAVCFDSRSHLQHWLSVGCMDSTERRYWLRSSPYKHTERLLNTVTLHHHGWMERWINNEEVERERHRGWGESTLFNCSLLEAVAKSSDICWFIDFVPTVSFFWWKFTFQSLNSGVQDENYYCSLLNTFSLLVADLLLEREGHISLKHFICSACRFYCVLSKKQTKTAAGDQDHVLYSMIYYDLY